MKTQQNTGRGQNTINRVVWLAYLATLETSEPPYRYFNGRPLNDSMSRSLHRWRNEGACPSFFTVDEWCVGIGLHIDEFFDWAEERGLDPWLNGEPDWHREYLES